MGGEPDAATRTAAGYSIHAVEKALDLLEAICDQGEEIRVSELSERLGLNKTNVFRLLATFENRGLVERGESSNRYRLGLTAYEMGRRLLSQMDILRKARPAMERLARQTGEAVYFLAPRQSEVLMLDMIDSLHQVKVVPLVCRRLPLASSLGQLFVAFGNGRERQREAGEGLSPELLGSIRSQGYVIDRQSFDEGVTSLGVPLFDVRGRLVAALALIGPSFRMVEQRIERDLLPVLRDAGAAVSTSLGYVQNYLAIQAV